jgi:hypothetical protein
MRLLILLLALASLSPTVTLAQELATPTPTPTPAFLGWPGRHGPAWQERVVRRSERRIAADNQAEARAQQKATRLAAAKSQAEVREAARARADAQRQVAAENRREARAEKPQLTSDLMRRMGFSEQEIAAQKAREQSSGASAAKPIESASPGQ